MVGIDVKPTEYVQYYKAAAAPMGVSVRAGQIATNTELTRAIARALWSKWSIHTAATFTAVERREADWGTHRTPQQRATEAGGPGITESKGNSRQRSESGPGTAKRKRSTTDEATADRGTDKKR